MLERPALYPWNDAAVAMLKRLWNNGMSCSQIATELGPGFTKNAVIGKGHRLKLPTKPNPQSRGQKSAMGRAAAKSIKAKRPKNGKGQPKPQAIAAAIEAKRENAPIQPFDVEDDPGAGVDVTHLVGIMDLKAHDCRWIEGDPLNVHGYCGKRAREDSSYCAEHHRRVYMGYSR